MEISDAVGIRIREDNKGNNKEDMDSKNLFFLKFMLRFTHRRYIMIASHKLKRYQGKGIKIPLRTAAASFYISWPGAYPVKRSGSAGDILYTYVCRYKALNHSKPRNNSFTMKISKTIRFCAFLLKFYRFCVVFF